jgi:thiol-disulfide isomerase/thioredoxin
MTTRRHALSGMALAPFVFDGFVARAAGTSASRPVAIISLAEFTAAMKQRQGQVVLLHLWATWCTPCVRELPVVAAWAKVARARGVDVYSVSLDDASDRGAAKVARMLDERGSETMTRTILRLDDPDGFVARVDPSWEGAIPAFFVYDRTGKLRHAHVGDVTPERLDQLLGDLAGKSVKK